MWTGNSVVEKKTRSKTGGSQAAPCRACRGARRYAVRGREGPTPEWERVDAVHRDVGWDAIREPIVRWTEVVGRFDAKDFDAPSSARGVPYHQAQPMRIRSVRRGKPGADRKDTHRLFDHQRQ